MAVRVAYGDRDNLEEAIASGKIPPGAFIVTEEKGELYFYDSTGKLERIVSKDWIDAILKEEQLRAEAEENRQAHEDERETSEKARSSWGKYDSLKRYVPGNKVTLNGNSFVCKKACQGVSPSKDVNVDVTAKAWMRAAAQGQAALEAAMTDADIVAMKLSKDSTGTSFYTAADKTVLVAKLMVADGDKWTMDGGFVDWTDGTCPWLLPWDNLQCYLINGVPTDNGNENSYTWKKYAGFWSNDTWLLLVAKGDKGDTGVKGDKGDKGDTPQKGVDYFTEADITAIVDLVLAHLAEQKEAGA